MAVLTAALLAAGCTAVSADPAATAGGPVTTAPMTTGAGTTPRSDRLNWTACTDRAAWDAAGPTGQRKERLEVRCAVLRVPLDHAYPDGDRLDIAVERVRSTTQHDRIGSLILNPGGPAASGLDFMPAWAGWFPDALLERFDLVTFDPRGTGSSSPIDCPDPPPARTDASDILSDAGFAAVTRRVADTERACAASLGAAAGHYGTDAVAHDLDLLRRTLGEERLTFIGWSYGARLGAHYAHLFPDRVRAVVLDAPPHPNSATADVVEAQLDGFEALFADYVDTCRSRPSCALVADQPHASYDRVIRRARSIGIRSGRPAGDPPAGPDDVRRAVLGFLASPPSWPQLDAALGEADRGDSGSFWDMIDNLRGRTPAHPDADTDDAMGIVQCTDTEPPPDRGAVRGQIARLAREHPTFGTYGASSLLACTGWPAAARKPLPRPESLTRTPVLVVAGLADANTPIGGAQAMVRAIGPSAVLLTSKEDGHTSFGRSECVDRHVVRYLVAVRPPPVDTACS